MPEILEIGDAARAPWETDNLELDSWVDPFGDGDDSDDGDIFDTPDFEAEALAREIFLRNQYKAMAVESRRDMRGAIFDQYGSLDAMEIAHERGDSAQSFDSTARNVLGLSQNWDSEDSRIARDKRKANAGKLGAKAKLLTEVITAQKAARADAVDTAANAENTDVSNVKASETNAVAGNIEPIISGNNSENYKIALEEEWSADAAPGLEPMPILSDVDGKAAPVVSTPTSASANVNQNMPPGMTPVPFVSGPAKVGSGTHGAPPAKTEAEKIIRALPENARSEYSASLRKSLAVAQKGLSATRREALHEMARAAMDGRAPDKWIEDLPKLTRADLQLRLDIAARSAQEYSTRNEEHAAAQSARLAAFDESFNQARAAVVDMIRECERQAPGKFEHEKYRADFFYTVARRHAQTKLDYNAQAAAQNYQAARLLSLQSAIREEAEAAKI